jgi:hypothetical protein
MKQKVVYQDGDYTKVVYGAVEYKDGFVVITTENGNEIRIGQSYVISIMPREI